MCLRTNQDRCTRATLHMLMVIRLIPLATNMEEGPHSPHALSTLPLRALPSICTRLDKTKQNRIPVRSTGTLVWEPTKVGLRQSASLTRRKNSSLTAVSTHHNTRIEKKTQYLHSKKTAIREYQYRY